MSTLIDLERTVNRDEVISCTFDGGSEVLGLVDAVTYVPYRCQLKSATLLAGQNGDIVIDIRKRAFAAYPPLNVDTIVGGSPPTLVSDDASQDLILSGWNTLIEANSTLLFAIQSVSLIKSVTLVLKTVKL